MNILQTADIRELFKGGAINLKNNSAYIDSLNVFPVPDGDTGTNMNLTVTSSVKEMDAVTEDRMDLVCEAFARGALKGARGNSGVILSQIFKGMSQVMSEYAEVTTKIFARALKNGSNAAYDVVTHPKEGTILTVIRLVSDYALKISTKKKDFIEFFDLLLVKGEEVVKSTPEMLPVLKKAGVVDAGGKGLLTILYGMSNVLKGVPMQELSPAEAGQEKGEDLFDAPDVHDLDDIKFAYCTEFFIINMKKKTTLSDIDKLRDKLNNIGDCVIVVGDLTLVKVHVHTNNPDKALGYALMLGELDKPKIENMLEQNRALKKSREERKEEVKPVSLVSICNGEGIKRIFTELRVDKILEGGQTMNPSVADIVGLVDSTGSDTVYILPNNSNIVLAAEQARELTKAKLVVIATKNIPQGITAAINFNPEASEEENVEMMRRAIRSVKSAQVTRAVRDTEMDGFDLHNGDVIGIYDRIVAKGDSVNEVAREVVAKMVTDETAAISLYYGAGLEASVAEELQAVLQDEYPFHDVMVYEGGQQHYFYYISVE
ncbi:MAG: DAK2 domain-containing protein [Firmicutes bacterium]|uniref:DAK2 domain-containing protein n=1 Tax=Candidatus Stercoripulliclostridium pullicola TaxID=2840953 RepID=A0A940IDN3_9FIRM|nr:DAK2 domain-containing protein [Candidatus Stercoripulliclostridium pullicola]